MANIGKFLSFEGIDGAGKTTMIQALADYLRSCNIEVYISREPGGTMLGERLRDILLDGHELLIDDEAELLMMFAARQQHVKQIIQPKIAAGIWVLSDRYVDASFAYQGAGRGISLEKIKQLYTLILNNFAPDLTLIFDISIEESLNRASLRQSNQEKITQDRFEKQALEFKQKVNDYYLNLKSNEMRQYFHLNAMQSPKDIQNDLIDEINRRWKLTTSI